MPTPRFFQLAPPKQTLIYQALLQEFATHPYEEASTNRIVKQANIAKGSLFNYFKDKEDLYLYTLQRAHLQPHCTLSTATATKTQTLSEPCKKSALPRSIPLSYARISPQAYAYSCGVIRAFKRKSRYFQLRYHAFCPRSARNAKQSLWQRFNYCVTASVTGCITPIRFLNPESKRFLMRILRLYARPSNKPWKCKKTVPTPIFILVNGSSVPLNSVQK